MYFAPGATHAPHHVPKEWSDKYRGRFDAGWDVLREQILARQKKLGVVPEDAELTKRHDEIPAWDDMPADLKPVLAREMEIYAGFLEQTDHEVGRVIDGIEDLGVLDDALISYIIGDNGASAEGTPNGCFNEWTTLNGMAGIETTEFLLSKIDDFGTPDAYNHYAVGWAHALCTPYQWMKQIASHWGGTRNGTIVYWPDGFADKGKSRNQFHHVIDVAKTILEVAGLPEPTSVNGIQQAPLEGISMLSTLRDANAPETHDVQYFEIVGNRGIYHRGWTAVTKHRTPWLSDAPPFEEDIWELYGPDDWTQGHNIAQENPDKLAELQRLWLIEAVEYNVVPLDDRSFERFNADIAGRPELIRGNSQLLFPGMRLNENCRLTLKNKSYSVTANLTVPPRFRRHRRHHCPRRQHRRMVAVCPRRQAEALLQLLRHRALHRRSRRTASRRAAPGAHGVRHRGGGLGKGGDITLYYDGRAVGSGRVDKTEPMIYSADEACDIACDTASPVSPDYAPAGNTFTGDIAWVQIDIGNDGHDHLISPDDRLNIAMAKQ